MFSAGTCLAFGARMRNLLLTACVGVVIAAVVAATASGCGGTSGSGVGSGDDGGGGGGAGDDGGGSGNAAGCPANVPAQGSSCFDAGLACHYDCAHGGGNVSDATCTAGKWNVITSEIACEPGDSGDGGAIACGSTTCSSTQLCVSPCCGGAQPACVEPNGGTCPPGTHAAVTCPKFPSGEGCAADPCTPPPPYCIDDPSKLPYGCTQSKDAPRNVSCLCA